MPRPLDGGPGHAMNDSDGMGVLRIDVPFGAGSKPSRSEAAVVAVLEGTEPEAESTNSKAWHHRSHAPSLGRLASHPGRAPPFCAPWRRRGRFPKKEDANLAAEEAEKEIRRFLTMAGKTVPSWITIAGISWPRDGDPLRSSFGSRGGLGVSGSLTVQGASDSDSATLRVAIVHLDGNQTCDLYPAGFDWKPRVEQILEGLGTPIKGIRVYDSSKAYLDKRILMWGGDCS